MNNSSFVSRINQIDAVQLDDEIYKILRSQTDVITKYFAPGKVVKWRPEIDVFIKYLIWNYSLKTHSSTFGQQLLNLSYKNLDKRKAIFLLLFTTVPDYLRERLINENFILTRVSSNYERSKYQRFVEQVDNFVHLLNFIWNFLFLNLGNQPRFIEKLLGIYNQSLNTNKPRSIGYSYMTRELLWHGLIELFTIGLPMINFRYILKLWKDLWSQKKTEKNIVLNFKLEPNAICSYCQEPPILPRWAGCSHVFCYYCLEAHFTIMDTYQCPICDKELLSTNMKTFLNI